jgi:protein phosphatase
MALDVFGITDPGCVRSSNQDCILTDAALGLFLVCDGMGGHQHGEIAADLAKTAVRHCIETSADRSDVSWPFGFNFDLSLDANRLSTGLRVANRQVWRRAEQSLEYAGMGTTIAAVLLSGDQAIVANIGDSRVYVLRAGELRQLTIDDTIIGSLVQRGLISPADTLKHPMRNVLTQAAGSQETVEVHLHEEPLQSGDTLLLCSDGLHGVIGDDGVGAILRSEANPEQHAAQLIAAARNAGGPDNISAVVVRYAV